jgi:hypothetical protein
MARPRHGPGHPYTIVIKLGALLALRPSQLSDISPHRTGTSSIVHETTHQPLLSTLSAVVELVVHLRAQGHKVVLVSSGAIGIGLRRMDLASKPKGLSGKQVRVSGEAFDGCAHGLRRSLRSDKVDSSRSGIICSVSWNNLSRRCS